MDKKQAVCTVLVSVYNGERFLEKCLDSLVSQTIEGVEVVVIDDASTDGSWQIMERYSRKHANIKTLRLATNSGQPHACNEGLKVATGKYICFLDADDWFAPDTLERAVAVYDRYPQTDCVLFDVVMWYSDDHEEAHASATFDVLTGYEAFIKSLSWDIHGVYMARAEIFERHPYDESCKAYSNDNTTRLHYYISREVRCCTGRYYYRQHPASLTHSPTLLHFDYLRANESMKRQLQELDIDDAILSMYENVRWLVLVDCYRFYFIHRHDMTRPMRREALAEMRRVWLTIELPRLEVRNRYKLGFMPLRFSWRLFCLQEELYFHLKKWTRRL